MKNLIAFLAAAILALAADDAAAQTTPRPLNDCSVTIATGGTAVVALTQNLNRNYLFIENPSATVSGVTAESAFANADATAASDGKSMELGNLGSITFPGTPGGFVPTGPISLNAPTTGHKIVCKWN